MSSGVADKGDDENKDKKEPNRAKARWAILRNALLGNAHDSNDNSKLDLIKSSSIHRFPGFRLLDRTTVIDDGTSYYYRRLMNSTTTIRLFVPSCMDASHVCGDVVERLETASCAMECLTHHDATTTKGKKERSERDGVEFIVELVASTKESFEIARRSAEELKRRYDFGTSSQSHDDRNNTENENDDLNFVIQMKIPMVQVVKEMSSSSREPSSLFNYECVQYSLSVDIPLATTLDDTSRHANGHGEIKILTRERVTNSAQNQKISLRALTSQQNYGVDNTGNICVWDSASTLAYVILHSCCRRDSPIGLANVFFMATTTTTVATNENNNDDNNRILRVIELGAGMAGLAGLSIGAAAAAGGIAPKNVRVEVTLTDGHPHAVRSNAIAATLTSTVNDTHSSTSSSSSCSSKVTMTSRKLLWKSNEEGVVECEALGRYQLALVSDCLHFRECHGALLVTIGRLLTVGGVGLLCQPKRGSSMELFVNLVKSVNDGLARCGGGDGGTLFDVGVWEQYDEEVTRRHREFEKRRDYDPGIHYPWILVLKKLREYDEKNDTDIVMNCLKERGKV